MIRPTTAIAAATLLAACAVAQGKTQADCVSEFLANKAKIVGAQSEEAFLAACRQGQEVVSGATTSARPAVPPATAAAQPATPAKSAGEAEKPAAAP